MAQKFNKWVETTKNEPPTHGYMTQVGIFPENYYTGLNASGGGIITTSEMRAEGKNHLK